MAGTQFSSSKCNVFLSFRGLDTRSHFIKYLHEALVENNFRVFMDVDDCYVMDDMECRGTILDDIERSKIAIIVFSFHYESSSWCVSQLAKIIERMDCMEMKVIPVFYRIDPRKIGKRKDFAEVAAYDEKGEEDIVKTQRWMSALSRAASLPGFHSTKDPSKDGYLIHDIIEDVSRYFNSQKSQVSGNVGNGKTKAKDDDWKKPMSEVENGVYNNWNRNHVAASSAVPKVGSNQDTLTKCRSASCDGGDVSSRAMKSGDDELEHIIKGVMKVYRQLNSQILYDVFISFRGEDTRCGFTGNLYNALVKEKIRAFMDDEGLHMGDHISQVFQAIEQSRMSILVFSENYATSEWCLNELVKILDCMDSKGQVVLPVFYKVTPSMVRNQTGSYGKAMADHEITYGGQMNYKVCEWRSALKKASYIIGRELKEGGYEYKIIEEIKAIVSEKMK